MKNSTNYIQFQTDHTSKHFKDPDIGRPISSRLTERYAKAFKRLAFYITRHDPILDVGCCDGKCADYFRMQGYSNYRGLDVSFQAASFCLKKNVFAVIGDAHNIPCKTFFYRAVLLIHTLEHCIDPGKVLREVNRILVTDGMAYVNVPTERAGSHIPTKGGHHSFFPNGWYDVYKLALSGDYFRLMNYGIDWILLRKASG